MINKTPRHLESFCQFSRQRFDAKRFRRVMAPIQDIQAEFFGEGKRPVRTFSRDEGIDSFGGSAFQLAARAASDDADAFTNRRPSSNDEGLCSPRASEPARQLPAWISRPGPEAH